MSPRFPPPGAGFLLVVAGILGAAGFLGWGFSTPLLDRVWSLLQRTEIAGFQGLTDREADHLEAALARHPSLAQELLGNRAARIVEPSEERWCALARQHLVVSSGWRGKDRLRISLEVGEEALPVSVRIRGPGLDEELGFEEVGAQELSLPLEGHGAPALLRVSL
ncbi:MAG: hypothetical protein FJ098_10165, partial [Deltaproteobacteria bacterium]|nr:hypothetical protein [Deltaproteobacteria bacterium]